MSDTAIGDGGQGGATGGVQGGTGSGEGVITLTHAQLNAMQAEHKRGLQRELAKQREEYERLRQQTEELLQGRPIDEFRSELEATAAKLRSAEEQAKIEQGRFQRQLQEAQKAAEQNAKRYEDAVIGRALTDAALADNKAISVEAAGLLAKELRGLAAVDPETGTVTVAMEVEEEGIKTTKQLTPQQAVTVLESRPGWAPLFKSHVSGGSGGGNASGVAQRNGRPDVASMSMEQYAKYRKDNPNHIQQLTS